jgi:hypothetical protein
MWRTYFVVAAFTLLAGLAGASEPKPQADAIKQWIKQLDAEAFADREAASAALVEIGPEARAPLEAALAEPDASPELRLRGREVLKQLELMAIRQNALHLSAIIEQATLANRDKLDHAKLETMLEQLVEVWSEVSGEAKSLPVALKDVHPAGIGEPASRKNALLTLDYGHISFCENCIVLAETAVDITSARSCIIIAGTSASISSPQNCIILAGEHIFISSAENSLVLSGVQLEAGSTRKSTLGASRTLKQAYGENVTLLNPPENERRDPDPFGGRRPERIPKDVRSQAIVLEMPERKNPLEGVITLTLVLKNQTRPLVLFKRKGHPGEYVARVEEKICSPDGPPIPELEGWKLVYCGSSSFAVFKKGEESAVLRLPVLR